MKHFARFLTPIFCVWLGAAGAASAVEPWADAKLPVKDGLELWLDASRVADARQAAGLSALKSGSGLDRWQDASGQGRFLSQPVREARPQFRRLAASAFLRFDGKDDFLFGNLRSPVSLTNLTVLIFAAPSTNRGGYGGLIAWNKSGGNDYQTGFNIDLGGRASTNWSALNVEAAGSAGERNLLIDRKEFGAFHTIAITSEAGEKTGGSAKAGITNFQTRLYLDGVVQKGRPRDVSPSILEELTVGARNNDNAGGPPYVQGFFAGEIAEILVYGRALDTGERRQVETYLQSKYADLSRVLNDSSAPIEKPLVTVSNPPPVQMLVPGFVVRQLPVQLNNVNNLVYAPDGRLFALGYDGNVFELKDTDGDGLEDQASYFFKNDRNEIPATIGMAWGPGGLYIPAKGRIIRLRDKGDGTGELETFASGWVPPAKFGGSSLDAVAITVDHEGNVYFGLGCDDWTGAYRVNKDGKSDYNIKSERGTIIKFSPDRKTREVLGTGLRWPSSLAFNAAGDLFCTDQEGATWLPNGNPFDELLHIQTGRHYGFPPRHPKYLPDAIDEPSVFDYAPQHESTCGLHFNEREELFGPDWWRGDAIVSGESRGKIWRTKLVKTAGGYVAKNQIIACLSMLTIDAVPSPQGDLVVTCHSGLPDWGTGPQGKGKLFKISYRDKTAPQPVLAYAASPTETRVVFDRPIEPARLKNLAAQSAITMGRYVTAGDRFESFRPGYQVVQNQMLEPRFDLPVLSAAVGADGRSISLQTASRIKALNYAVTLPDPVRAEYGHGEKATIGLPQQAAIDLQSDLNGVDATWRTGDRTEKWSGWLPHIDLDVADRLTRASADHRRLFELLHQSGTLELRTKLDPWLMLRPVTQVGSKLDFEYPPENVTLVFRGSAGIDVRANLSAQVARVSAREVRVTTTSKQDQWIPLQISLKTGAGEPGLEVTWFTAEDPRPRALQLRRLFLPWATPAIDDSPSSAERIIPEIAGGDWKDGRKLFFSDQVACYKCHQVGGEGGKLGPDLSNLVHRDYASVMKDITQPSAAINADHLAYNLELKDGEIVSGVIVSDDPESTTIGLATGAPMKIPKARIVGMKASAVSLMPENLLGGLDAQQRKSLLTFLLLPKP